MHRGVRSILEEWIFLALLGISMAVLSLGMDFCIEVLRKFHVIASDYIDAMGTTVGNDVAVFAVWSCYTVLLITMAVAFAHFVAPQAIGSGIPEMKTILQGVVLKEYLSFRTLISKMVGLTLSIGSGLPIGKEGPFVHVGSIVASGISHWARTFRPIYANESRSIEMLAAGCAVGVACTFSAPVGE
ncbi:hypothetical protein AB6A40_006570 [Gnathostoma spinigerum]|uniref:Chloride channel protein n=1 Tax=Gnathostoma spinigerum TaxID=75299 RepID=A0ABD6EKT5_9BILA